ncbi:hypothetical protein M0813_22892 [Anaeramoeba flamelloides]|uniref:Protein YIPF n=1 Tax=Anaeramoeba flamelloides TaxID=1746091 RepID=A0ABQ8YC09_9EUKA|nr:hypothetical protein M0813_22892 [Anaeramoeba flamelloides]
MSGLSLENNSQSNLSSGNEFLDDELSINQMIGDTNQENEKQLSNNEDNENNEGLEFQNFTPQLDLGQKTTENEPQPLVEEKQNKSPNDYPVWSLNYYSQYFEIETRDVLLNILNSINPIKGIALEKIDFFGPFWIATTLIVLLGSLGNLTSYIKSLEKNKDNIGDQQFDFHKITYASAILYCYVFIYPIVFWVFRLKSFLAHTKVKQLICLFGYSLSWLLPLCLFLPFLTESGKWVGILTVSALTGVSLVRTILKQWKQLENENKSKPTLIISLLIFVIHCGLGIAIKIIFF